MDATVDGEAGAVSKSMSPLEWSLLATLSLLWGGSFFFTEIALVGLPPFSIVFCRVFLAALTLTVLVAASGMRFPSSPGVWLAFLVMGAVNNAIPFSLIVWGQTRITGGLASIINATAPLFTVLLAHLLTRDERLSANRLSGVLLGFLGVVALVGPQALQGMNLAVTAELAILVAALSYAVAGIFGRRFAGIPPLVTAAGQLLGSSLIMLPVVALADRPWTLPVPGAGVAAAVIGLALASTAAAYVIYFRILATAGASNLLLVAFLIPVSAVILGSGFLGEELTVWQALGMLLIGLGLAVIDGRALGYLGHRCRRGGVESQAAG